MAKKLLDREKQEKRKNLFFLLFFTPGRATRAMLAEHRVGWKINVSILKKREGKIGNREKRNCSHHSNIFT
jgi:hypothetical protein